MPFSIYYTMGPCTRIYICLLSVSKILGFQSRILSISRAAKFHSRIQELCKHCSFVANGSYQYVHKVYRYIDQVLHILCVCKNVCMFLYVIIEHRSLQLIPFCGMEIEQFPMKHPPAISGLVLHNYAPKKNDFTLVTRD